MLRKIIAALILVPLGIVMIAIAMVNRQAVTVSFDPFSSSAPAAALTLPLFVIIFVTLVVGVIVGGLAVRLGHGRWRRMARRLEREAGELRAKIEALQARHAEPSIVPREQIPPPRLKLTPPAR
ncbi:MAG: LapA family protein [Xanthobacteraceae bacterium]